MAVICSGVNVVDIKHSIKPQMKIDMLLHRNLYLLIYAAIYHERVDIVMPSGNGGKALKLNGEDNAN